MNVYRAILAITAAAWLATLTLFASQTTSIAGRIVNEAGAPLPAATVTLVDSDRATRSTTSNAEGRFTFPDVPPGVYELRVEAPGFSRVIRAVTAELGASASIDVTLMRPKQSARPPGGAGAAPRPPVAADVAPSPDYTRVPVLYATDRRRAAAAAAFGVTYTRDRAAGDDLQYGRAVVTVPRDHRLGELESPRWTHLEFTPDPGKHVVLAKTEDVDEASFYASLQSEATGKEVLVFIHGYNVTFPDALRRTAQLAYDLQFSGPAVAYTWPGQDNAARYLIAESNVDWCKPHLEKFLSDLADRSGATRIHVIVHSLGNRIFAHAVDGLIVANPQRKPLFHNVIMAAADIDVDEFRQLAEKMKQSASSLTLYVSESDKALRASKKLAKYARVGQGGKGVVLVPGIDTIDATAVDKGFFWEMDHSYFGDSETVLGDIWELVRCGWKVTERDALRSVGATDPRLWRLLANGTRRQKCSESRPES